jgi:hypothetical protein
VSIAISKFLKLFIVEEYFSMDGVATSTVLPAFSSHFPLACHRLVLELSRAHKEGKTATVGDPSRVGERG